MARARSATLRCCGATDPQGYNGYSYVDNNPLTDIDLTGFQKETVPIQKENGEDYFSNGGFGSVYIDASRLAPFDGYGADWSSVTLNGAYGQVTKPSGSTEVGTAAAQEGVAPKGHPGSAAGSGQQGGQQNSCSNPYVCQQQGNSQQSNPPTVPSPISVTVAATRELPATFLPLDYGLFGPPTLTFDTQLLAKMVLYALAYHVGEQVEPVPPEPTTPEEQTTDQPYTPPESTAPPPTGQT